MQKIALALIVGFSLVYVYANYLLLPKWILLQEQRKQLQNRQSYYQELLSYQSNQVELAKTCNDLEETARNLTALIPSQFDKPQIMVDIYTLAKLHAVTPQTLKFETIQNKEDKLALVMNLNCSGQAKDIISLIDDLEHTPLHKFVLQSINLSSAKSAKTPAATEKVNVLESDSSYTNIAAGMPDKPQLNMELKFAAYSSTFGTADGIKQKPSFMFSAFGSGSIAKMFEPLK